MAFWVNSPTETTPISANNLSRMEKYTTATADSNGDFYVTINNSSGLATGDIVKITFPTATLNTADARLSIDGGTTYKNIYMGENLLASAVENKDIELKYNGTQFEPMCEVTDTNTNGTWIKNPDGRMTCHMRKTVVDSLGITSAWGTMYAGCVSTTYDYPKTFIEVPTEECMGGITNGACFVSTNAIENTTTNSSSYQTLRPTAAGGTRTAIYNITAIGRWK